MCHVTKTSTNGSAVSSSRDTDGDTSQWYCTAFGGNIGHVIQAFEYQLYLLQFKIIKNIIGSNLIYSGSSGLL